MRTSFGTDGLTGSDLNVYIGGWSNNNVWSRTAVNLSARLTAVIANEIILDLDGVEFRCKDLYIDDLVFSGGQMERTYAVVPGAATGGYLGAQGPETMGFDQWWYYHYDDLGNVVANTGLAGSYYGAFVPDAYGNYRTVYGVKRDSLGITSKFFDADAGVYDFPWRKYDPERGRWISEDPLGFVDGPNLYAYVHNSPTNAVDPTGGATLWDLADLLFLLWDIKDFASCPSWGGAGNVGLGIAGAFPIIPSPRTAKAAADALDAAWDWRKADADALRDIVNEATHKGHKALDRTDAETVLDWADEINYPRRASPQDVSGDNWKGGPHIHIPGSGSRGHVPVAPGVKPRPKRR